MTERLLFGFVPVYGLLIACGIMLGVFLCAKNEQRLGLPKDTAVDMALHAVPPAVIGARLYYVAFQWSAFRDNPISILYLWEGGLAIYGAVIGGFFGCLWLSKRKKIKLTAIIDMTMPSLLLGQVIGRWGNFVNGEAYGELITNPAWQFFPVAVEIGGQYHMATFFYESFWNLIGFALMYGFRKKAKRSGDLFLWYLLWYGAGRMVIEGLRTDSLMLGAIRVSQLLSLAMCVSALCVLALRAKHRATLALALPPIALMALFAATGAHALALSAAVCALAAGCFLYTQSWAERAPA